MLRAETVTNQNVGKGIYQIEQTSVIIGGFVYSFSMISSTFFSISSIDEN